MFSHSDVIKGVAPTTVSRRNLIRAGMLAGLGLAAGPTLAACGGASSSGGSGGPGLTWAGWDGPPQSERFRQFSETMTKKLGGTVTECFPTSCGDHGWGWRGGARNVVKLLVGR